MEIDPKELRLCALMITCKRDLEEIIEKIIMVLSKCNPEAVKQARSQNLGHITDKGFYDTLVLLGYSDAGSSIAELAEIMEKEGG